MKDLEIKVVSSRENYYIGQCLQIATENHISNGGTLMYYDLVRHAKYIVCAMKDGQVLGFAGMVEGFAVDNDFYVLQIAVRKDYSRKGVGSEILDYIVHHSKGYSVVTSNVKKTNEASNKLHLKAGFEQLDQFESYFYRLPTENIKNNQIMEYTEDENERE